MTIDVLHPKYLRQVNEELKAVVAPRLVLSPSAEFCEWLGRTAYGLPNRGLTKDEWCVIEIVAAWTWCRGHKWVPTDGVSTGQLLKGLDLPEHQGSKTIVSQAIDGVTSKGIWRMARGKSVRGHPNWYRFAFVDEILQRRPNLYPDQPDDEERDRLIGALAAIDSAAWAREKQRQDLLRLRAANNRINKVYVGVELDLPGVNGRQR